MIDVATIGAGGGSVAWVDPATKSVEVGPQSAGAQPGPAAFDLGGMEPTVTDADIVLGYIDVDNFLGGRMKLNRDKAVQAVADRIAGPLSLTVEEAALSIKQKVDANIGHRIAHEITLRGKTAGEFALLAYGGAGATHCCGYAEVLGLDRIITFPYSAVFSAFGSSTADVVHHYTHTEPMAVYSSAEGVSVARIERINAVIDDLMCRAARDARGEGFNAGEVTFELDIIAGNGDGTTRLIHSPVVRISGEHDLQAICEASFPGETSVIFDTLVLRARGAVPHWEMQAQGQAGEDPSTARKGEREAYWPGGYLKTPVYDYERLQCGNVVRGPAIIESDSTTYVLPAEAALAVDAYRNGIIDIAR
jgi:N-methylhydantoinase A/oxoprolinase/acetone carboxylase beta subunit